MSTKYITVLFSLFQMTYQENATNILYQQKETVFFVMTDSKKNWYEAFADCRGRGLDLASIENEKEYQNLYSRIKDIGYGRFWLSGMDLARTGEFVWMSTGHKVTYNKWHRGGDVIEPSNGDHDNGEREHCVELFHEYNYEMNDFICSETFNYICDDRNFKNPIWTEQRSKAFTVFTGNKLNWFEALVDCQRQGLRLATVESEEEQQELVRLIKSLGLPNGEVLFWLSGSDLGSVYNYVWMTSGQPLTYTAWNHYEPNHFIIGGEKERCLSLRSDFGYKWNDVICSNRHYYVCDNQA